jgi:hypothetical protein
MDGTAGVVPDLHPRYQVGLLLAGQPLRDAVFFGNYVGCDLAMVAAVN